ncbi:MAG: hydroxymethylbilane synthase [Proteobacteria bacterium]|nr:hydroxymethylbilane synthase [Pseudomonadota bacterium]
MTDRIIIGTRGSQLALFQANWVKTELIRIHPSLSVEIEIIKTKGDKILDVPLAKVGGKGLFVKEIEDALLKGTIDIAVHSMKDMPGDLPQGLCIGAVPVRETPNDVLISVDNKCLFDIHHGAKVGTSSLRRSSQLLGKRPDIEILPLRGNIDTRIKKLQAGEMDGIILAAAGVKRLNLDHHISELIDTETMLPAVGQGALCIEARENDKAVLKMIHLLDDRNTRVAVSGERAFLHRLEGGCQVPIAAYGKLENESFILSGLVADLDGSTVLKDTIKGKKDNFERLGIELAEQLLDKGAGNILEKLKNDAIIR